MALVQAMVSRMRTGLRAGLAALVVAVLLAAVACSPEDGRPRGGGLGADLGNTSLPIRMHGSRSYNNPSFQVPQVGGVPRDAKGVPGWWVGGP
ncbi:MAG TPA: hypothetical protein VFE37_07185 [Chloroflexota bacterium]|nr:hypothetical protein [Chloroflexota bacterium]